MNMAALVQMKRSRFAIIQSKYRRHDRVLYRRNISVREPRAFPEASKWPTLAAIIRDEMLELCAFTFCQGGPPRDDL